MVPSELPGGTAMSDCPNLLVGTLAYSRSYPCSSAIGGAATTFAAVNKPPLVVCNGVIARAVGGIHHVATHLFARKKTSRPSIDSQALRLLETGHGDGAPGDSRGRLKRLR